MRSFLKILTALAVISALSAFSLIIYDFFHTRGAFPPKTFIAEIDVSYLSPEEAAAKLKLYPISDLFFPFVTLEAEDRRYSFPPESLGIFLMPEESVANTFRLTRQNNYLAALRLRLTQEATFAPPVLGVNKEQLWVVLEVIGAEINASVKDASMTLNEKTGAYNIQPEVIGKQVNIEKTIDSFRAYLKQGKSTVPIIIDYTQPRIKEEDLRSHPPVYRLSAYTTYYGKHDSPNRIHNIKLVSSWLDGTLLLPGETFSVAEVLGDVTEEQGFKEAFVIIQGELVPLLGGGSCQIATTLYNAASLADIKILERRNHSFYFNIYPLGRDAAVYPGQIDFRLENDTPYPLLLKSFATNRKLSFRIYGTPRHRKVRFSKTLVYGKDETGKFVPMSLQRVIDEDLPFRTKVVRTVYEKNKIIKQETIQSRYKLYGDKENVPIRRPEPR